MRLQNLIWIALVLCPAIALSQNPTSTISGTVIAENGQPIPGVTVECVHGNATTTEVTDSNGRFSFPIRMAGIDEFRFKNPSGSLTANVLFSIDPRHDKDVLVILHPGKPAAADITIDEPNIPRTSTTERVYTTDWIESLPNTGHLWSLLNHSSKSVVTDYYDPSGLHSDRQMLMGIRGSSWDQNQFFLNGLNVTAPSGDGMLIFPDLAAMETTVYSIGSSSQTLAGPGAHLEMTPKAGGREVHGQAHLFVQFGALQGTNVTNTYRFYGITQSDERWKHYANSNFQVGGPVGKTQWTYLGSFSQVDQEKTVRNVTLPVSSDRSQGSLNLVGQLSSRDQLKIYWSEQHLGLPQSDAGPQTPIEASLDETQGFHNLQAVWTRSSAKSVVDLRVGMAMGNRTDGLQPGVQQQSRENLFPGYAILGEVYLLPNYSLNIVNRLSNVRAGAAPMAGTSADSHWDASATFSTFLNGPVHSTHRLSGGASERFLSSTKKDAARDNVNLFFFENRPNSVHLFNPTSTKDRVHQWDMFGTDTISFGRLSVNSGANMTFASGSNILASGSSANNLGWTNLSGNIGATLRLLGDRRPVVLRGRLARIYHQPLTSTWAAVNPEGQAIRQYSWNDINQDGQFQPGENTQLLKASGPAFSSLDPGLKNPYVNELSWGLSHRLNRVINYDVNLYRRVEHNLMSLVNTGVPFSAYTPVQVVDPGSDADFADGSDHAILTVYNQNRETLGQDKYLLTNPKGYNSLSEGFDITLRANWNLIQTEASLTRYRSVAATAPGFSARQNDTDALSSVFDDPNKAIFSYGSTFFDRGSLARLLITSKLPWNIHWSLIGSYQDGLPYSRYLPVQGLNQGLIGVLTKQRGAGAPGSPEGSMTTQYRSVNIRFTRSFALTSNKLTATVDVFNLTNESMALTQASDTSTTNLWRIPLTFETPRSAQLGLRYNW